MAQADMPEGIEHSLVGEHAARERKLIAKIVNGIGHGFLTSGFLNAALKPGRSSRAGNTHGGRRSGKRRPRVLGAGRVVSFCQMRARWFRFAKMPARIS